MQKGKMEMDERGGERYPAEGSGLPGMDKTTLAALTSVVAIALAIVVSPYFMAAMALMLAAWGP